MSGKYGGRLNEPVLMEKLEMLNVTWKDHTGSDGKFSTRKQSVKHKLSDGRRRGGRNHYQLRYEKDQVSYQVHTDETGFVRSKALIDILEAMIVTIKLIRREACPADM